MKQIACLIAAAVSLAACALLGGCGQKSYSASEDGNVTAVLTETGQNRYKLTLSGEGDVRGYASPSDAPWAEYAPRITEIELPQGIGSVGSHAFSGTNVQSVVIPEGLSRVERDAFPQGTIYFAYAPFECENPEDIYMYSSEEPQTGLHLWQSDRANGDVFSPDALKADENVWHMVYGVPRPWKTRVLFIGNSFTYTYNVPEIFHKIVNELGLCVETYAITGPGWYLDAHAKETDVCGKQVDALLKARNDFDTVILQEQSTCPYENPSRFEQGVTDLTLKIDGTQERALVALYSTWGYPAVADQMGWTVPEMEEKIRTAYQTVADKLALPVSPVGKAFTDVFEHHPEIALYGTDRKHQTYAGSYLAACVHAVTLFDADLASVCFTGELSGEDAAILQTAAMNALEDQS